MRILLAGVFLMGGVAAAQAQSFDIFSIFPNGGGRQVAYARQIAAPIVAHARRAAAAERARAAAEERRERRIRLSATAAGRRQLAQEDAAARKAAERQRRQTQQIVAWGIAALGSSGGGGSSGQQTYNGRTYDEAAGAYSACKGLGGSMCSSQ